MTETAETPEPGIPTNRVDPGHEVRHDVFISYASQDGALALAVLAKLEETGLTCWVAPRDVRPGTAYAESIIRAINGARVLVVLLSKHSIASSHVGKEIERASAKQRTIIALRTDGTPLTPSLEYFLSESQWIEVSNGNIGAVIVALSTAIRSFSAEVAGAGLSLVSESPTSGRARPGPRGPDKRWLLTAGFALILVVGGSVLIWHARTSKIVPSHPAEAAVASKPPISPAAIFSPPPHSIAVLPFLNMSGDPSQEYFSDGLSEELLNSLTTIRDLRVAARTSSFYFRGKDVDLSEVAHKLNVGAVLEGSVRKDGGQIRITAQLIDGITGFHLWSQSYDRSLKDVLKLQTDIATAVTKALQATLMADAAETIEVGGTNNPQALDAYLRGRAADSGKVDAEADKAAIANYDDAIRFDPKFAKAYASKAQAENGYAEYYTVESDKRMHFGRARAAAEHALALAPDLGIAHSELGQVLQSGFFDFKGALAEHEKALAISPNDPVVLVEAAWLMADIGRSITGITMVRRAVALDQLNWRTYRIAAIVQSEANDYVGAVEAADRALALNPSDGRQWALRGDALLAAGDVEAARESCEKAPPDWDRETCLAVVYHQLGQRADAESQLAEMQNSCGDSCAYQYAEITAQWGNSAKALDWLETAYRSQDPGLSSLRVDSMLHPLRNEKRFRDLLLKLNLPQ